MNKIISKYGTFIIIPPILAIIAIVALRFKVTTTAEVTAVQTAPDVIVVYAPLDIEVTDSIALQSAETGPLTLAVSSVSNEATLRRITCSGTLPPGNTLIRASIPTGDIPLYQVIINRR